MRWIGYLFGGLVLLLLIAVTALVLMPTGWIVERAETFAAEEYGLELDIGELGLDVLSMTPGASVSDVSLGDGEGGALVEGADARVAVDLRSLIGGELVLEEIALHDADIDLRVDENGRGNWQSVLDGLPEPAPAPEDESAEPGSVPAIRSLSIEDVRLDYADARLEKTLSLEVAASGSTTDPERPTVLDATGSFGDVPLDVDVELASLGELAGSLDALALDAEALAGDTRLALEGRIGDPATLEGLDLGVSLSAPDARDIEALAGIELPALPAIGFETRVERDGADFVLRRFDANLGDNALEGDVRANPAATPPELYANVVSPRLDVDALLALLPAAEEGAEQAEVVEEEAEAGGRVLPDDPIDLGPIVTAFDGAVRLQALEVVFAGWPVDDFDIRVENGGGTLALAPFEVGVAGGTVSGSGSYASAASPAEANVELEATGIGLNAIVAALGVDDDSFGTIGGRAKYWLAGDSVASLAANLDGGAYIAMSGGKLDALLVELSAIDLIESIALLVDPDKTLTNVDCGYVDLQSADGVTDIETFVLETADTVYIAGGSVDLNDESFDVKVEPHPRDASLFSIDAGVRAYGTLSDVNVLPGAELGARSAVAAALVAVAAPAAALIAFIEPGDGEDSPYCSNLVDALPDAG